jgi:lipopolysaccharide transport system ATP-binding protein
VRLGFSVAVHSEPEILLIDETLAVGDQVFQTKCMDKMAELRRYGVTVLLVSHDLAAVQGFCRYAGWMENGRLEMFDVAEPVIGAYLRQTSEVEKARFEQEQEEREDVPPQRSGDGAIRIHRVEMLGADGHASWVFQATEAVRVRLHFDAGQPLETPVFSILVYRDDGLYVSGANTCKGTSGSVLPAIAGRGYVEVELPALTLADGHYLLSVGAYVAPDPPFWANPADFHDRAYRFRIESNEYVHGVVALPTHWRVVAEEE